MATAVGKLAIFITANAKGFVGGLNSAKGKLAEFGSKMGITRGELIAFTAVMAAGAVAARGLYAAFEEAATRLDTLAKTSAKLGATTEAMEKLRFAGVRSGLTMQTVDLALQRFTRRAAEAAVGTGEAQGALKDLGLDAAKLSAMPLDKKMLALAGAFEKVTDEGQQLRLAFKLFDAEGAGMVAALKGGEKGLKAYYDRAVQLGVATQQQIDDAQRVRDSTTDLKMAYNALTNNLVTALAPAFVDVTEKMVDFLAEAKNDGSIQSLGDSLGDLLILLAKIAKGFQDAAKESDKFLFRLSGGKNGLIARAGRDFAVKPRTSDFDFNNRPDAVAEPKMDSATESAMVAEMEATVAMLKEGEKLKEKMKTVDEKYVKEVDNLKKLLAAGAIDQETFNRATKKLRDAYVKAAEEIPELMSEYKKRELEILEAQKTLDLNPGRAPSLKPKETPVEINKQQLQQMSNPQALLKGSAAAISKSLELQQQRQKDSVADAVKEQQDAQVDRLDKIIENTEQTTIVVGLA